MPITDGVSSNPAQARYASRSYEFESSSGEVYSTQHYVIKFVSLAGQCFFPGTPVFSTNKTDRYDIAEILLKVALNTHNFSSVGLVQNIYYHYHQTITRSLHAIAEKFITWC